MVLGERMLASRVQAKRSFMLYELYGRLNHLVRASIVIYWCALSFIVFFAVLLLFME